MQVTEREEFAALVEVAAMAYSALPAETRAAMEAHERAIREEQERRQCA